MSADHGNTGRQKTTDKVKAEQIRARAEAALADVRRRSESWNALRRKKGV